MIECNNFKLEMKDLKYNLTKIDDNNLEGELKKDESLNDLVGYLTQHGVRINSIRPKGNRLEELFLNVLKD